MSLETATSSIIANNYPDISDLGKPSLGLPTMEFCPETNVPTADIADWEQELLDAIDLDGAVRTQNAQEVPTELFATDAKDPSRLRYMHSQRGQDHGTRGDSNEHFKPWRDPYYPDFGSTGMHRSMTVGPFIADFDEEDSIALSEGLGFSSSQDTKPYTAPSPDERSFVPTGRRVTTERDQLATSLARDVEAGRLAPKVARARYMESLDGPELARFLGAISRWLE